jgi:hypothetical protein
VIDAIERANDTSRPSTRARDPRRASWSRDNAYSGLTRPRIRSEPIPDARAGNRTSPSPACASYSSTLAKLARFEVLVLDDFLLALVKDAQRRDLLEVLEDCYERALTVNTSQVRQDLAQRPQRSDHRRRDVRSPRSPRSRPRPPRPPHAETKTSRPGSTDPTRSPRRRAAFGTQGKVRLHGSGRPIHTGHFEVRKVAASGRIRWKRATVTIDHALEGELIGIEPGDA